MKEPDEILTTEGVADHFNDRHRDNLGKRGPMGKFQSVTPKPTLDEVLAERAPVAARPDFRARNAWIEGGCVGPDPWAPKRKS